MIKYVALPNTWFDEGTEAYPVTNIEHGMAVFCGVIHGHIDEETCSVDDFTIEEVVERVNHKPKKPEPMKNIIHKEWEIPKMQQSEYDDVLTCEEVLCKLRKILKVKEGCSIIEKAEDIMDFYENN